MLPIAPYTSIYEGRALSESSLKKFSKNFKKSKKAIDSYGGLIYFAHI